jgi:hypothetical protein
VQVDIVDFRVQLIKYSVVVELLLSCDMRALSIQLEYQKVEAALVLRHQLMGDHIF